MLHPPWTCSILVLEPLLHLCFTRTGLVCVSETLNTYSLQYIIYQQVHLVPSYPVDIFVFYDTCIPYLRLNQTSSTTLETTQPGTKDFMMCMHTLWDPQTLMNTFCFFSFLVFTTKKGFGTSSSLVRSVAPFVAVEGIVISAASSCRRLLFSSMAASISCPQKIKFKMCKKFQVPTHIKTWVVCDIRFFRRWENTSI